MKKLSESRNSKKYLTKSKKLPISVERKLKQASKISNERIEYNNNIYIESNSHSNDKIMIKRR